MRCNSSIQKYGVSLKEHATENFDTLQIVEAGLDKLSSYYDRIEPVPAYVLSLILNPEMKMNWFYENAIEKVQWAKTILIQELKPYYNAAKHRNNTENPPLHHQDSPVQQYVLAPAGLTLTRGLSPDDELMQLEASKNEQNVAEDTVS
ncbi:hypothetical protein BDQ17DRAFT_1322019 [Cyathus striatus]|nr:hypothetical protein BDQ17DRAFT_1322019 [Cyathus striatus]